MKSQRKRGISHQNQMHYKNMSQSQQQQQQHQQQKFNPQQQHQLMAQHMGVSFLVPLLIEGFEISRKVSIFSTEF